MNLTQAVDQYAISRDVRKSTLAGYRLAVRSFGLWLGRPPAGSDLTTDNLNRWLHALRTAETVSPHTIATYRRGLLVVHRWMARRGDAPRPDSSEITAVRCPPTARLIWTADEVRQLISSVDKLADYPINRIHVRRQLWWRSLLMTAWDTALRWSDLARLRRSDIDRDGVLRITQRKTSLEHVGRISPVTLEVIRESFRGVGVCDRELIWPVPYATWRHRDLVRLLTVAGMAGNLQKLRRSAITAAELDQSGQGMLLAGHTNASTTLKWYIPRSALYEKPPAPPHLMEVTEMGTSTKPKKRRFLHAIRHDGEVLDIVRHGKVVAEVSVKQDKRGRLEVAVESDADDPVNIKVRRGD